MKAATCCLLLASAAEALRLPSSRRDFFLRSLPAGAAALGTAAPAARATDATDTSNKLTGLSDAELARRVKEDVEQRQFLCTADFTRALYDESATFSTRDAPRRAPWEGRSKAWRGASTTSAPAASGSRPGS